MINTNVESEYIFVTRQENSQVGNKNLKNWRSCRKLTRRVHAQFHFAKPVYDTLALTYLCDEARYQSQNRLLQRRGSKVVEAAVGQYVLAELEAQLDRVRREG